MEHFSLLSWALCSLGCLLHSVTHLFSVPWRPLPFSPSLERPPQPRGVSVSDDRCMAPPSPPAGLQTGPGSFWLCTGPRGQADAPVGPASCALRVSGLQAFVIRSRKLEPGCRDFGASPVPLPQGEEEGDYAWGDH